MEYDKSRKKTVENRQELRYHELICRRFAAKGCKKDTGSQNSRSNETWQVDQGEIEQRRENIPTPAERRMNHTIASRRKPPHHIPQKQKVDYQIQKTWELHDIRPHRMTKKCKVIWRATGSDVADLRVK